MSKISLTTSMRSNLLSLQNISRQVSLTQNRLATGKKVNSAIDNPSNFYTASSLVNRANDLSMLLDSMGEAMSTIKAATEGMMAGLKALDQAASVAEQAVSDSKRVPMKSKVEFEDNVDELIDAGYTKVDKNTTLSQLKTLLQTNNAKIVLAEDVEFASSLVVSGSNVTINGGGHSLKAGQITLQGANANIVNAKIDSTSSGSALVVKSAGFNISNSEINNSVATFMIGVDVYSQGTIENVTINLSNKQSSRATGISLRSGANVEISGVRMELASRRDNVSIGVFAYNGSRCNVNNVGIVTEGGHGLGTYSEGGIINGVSKLTNEERTLQLPSSWYSGEENTATILSELKGNATAANAANNYYVDSASDENFGQGTWYLPSLGELMDMYGYDYSKMTGGSGTSGAIGDNMKEINKTLEALNQKGVSAYQISGFLWSSLEGNGANSWWMSADNGNRSAHTKNSQYNVRCFQNIENCYDPAAVKDGLTTAPKIGDIVYTDKSYGTIATYDSSKTVAGVVSSVSEDGSVKVVSLTNAATGTVWSTTSNVDVEAVENFDYYEFWVQRDPARYISVDDINQTFGQVDYNSYNNQYNEIVAQYDNIVNDASFKGINLLANQSLGVKLNEKGDASLTIQGKDVHSEELGLSLAEWDEIAGVQKSIQELRLAIDSIRKYTSELGNNYSIIQNRQDFTDSLINVLTEGADKLVLADMNEESAKMLALQTRQQLATNSLSLAAQASQSILKLF